MAEHNEILTRYQDFYFPSPIVKVKIDNKVSSFVIRIPETEVSRVNMILKDEEYSLPDAKRVTNPMTIIDVGANVGIFAIYGKILNPENVIHCFEPSPHTLSLLQANVGSVPGIHIHPIGLSNFEGDVLLNRHPCNTGEDSIRFRFENKDSHSIVSHAVKIHVGNAADEFDKLVLEHVDILKIDTEGCEVEVLECLNHRLSIIDYVMVEYHSEADRRKVDNLLSAFNIYAANISGPGQGTVKYINNRLI